MLTSLQKAKDQAARITAVNPLPEVSMMMVSNPNPRITRILWNFPSHGLVKARLLPICISPE